LSKIFFIFLFLLQAHIALAAKPVKFLVYYNDKAPYEQLAGYDLLVFDSKHHPAIRPLAGKGKVILGYISLGEVEKHRSYYKAVKKQGILGQENKDWPGSYFINQKDPRWAKRVISELIPKILQKGFDGIFLDTLDNPGYLEKWAPLAERSPGQIQAAVNLLKAIRHHYPKIKIMMNRGYELLAYPEIAKIIDYEMAESLYSDYNFKTKKYQKVSKEDYDYTLGLLAKAKQINPRLKIVSLDYWNPKDTKGILEIYEIERQNGFIPYVSTVELDRVIPVPTAPKQKLKK